MISQEKLQKYQDWLFRVSAYNMALSIIMTDKMTVAPVGGGEYRDAYSAASGQVSASLFNGICVCVNDSFPPEVNLWS